MNETVKKCLVCAMQTTHRFKECISPDCLCGCIYEIRGEEVLPFEEWPEWFRVVSRKDIKRFTKIHVRKGN